MKIADGFENACDIAIKRLEAVTEEVDIKKGDFKYLRDCAKTALGSKVVSSC